MDTVRYAIKEVSKNRRYLTQQQYRTIKGQVLAGDVEGAMKGLKRVLGRQAAAKQAGVGS